MTKMHTRRKKKRNSPLFIKEIGLVISHYQKSNYKAKMVNSSKYSTKIDFHNYIHKLEAEETFFYLSYEADITLKPKMRKHSRKKKATEQYLTCENSRQNISKLNSTM